TNDFRSWIDPLMAAFASPAPTPTTISFRSADAKWVQWGWSAVHYGGGFSILSAANAAGFTAHMQGTLVVATPAFYAPYSAHLVRTIHGATPTITPPVADAMGRLHITVRGGLIASTVKVLAGS